MAKFCGKCGTPLPENSAFCLACGAQVPPSASAPIQPPMPSAPATPTYAPVQPSPYQQPPQTYAAPPQIPAQPPPQQQWSQPPIPSAPQPQWSQQPSQPGYSAAPPAPTAKGGSALKIILILVVILGLGAVGVAGALWYVGHKVVSKIKDTAANAGISTEDLGHQGKAITGDPCRFLTKAEVGTAIGVPITETQSTHDGCSYLAHGTLTDMTSRHVAAMLGQRGADKKTQDTIQNIAGGFFGAQQKPGENADEAGNAVVLAVSIDANSARSQMKLNAKILGGLPGDPGSSSLRGIGDEAFVAADGMMMVRKGDTLIRLMYTSCPCGTEQIKPLAIKLADAF